MGTQRVSGSHSYVSVLSIGSSDFLSVALFKRLLALQAVTNRKIYFSHFRSDLHLPRNLATSRVWAEVPVAFLPSLDLHALTVRECWLCVHEPLHGAVPSLSYVLPGPFPALFCSKEVLPFQRAFPITLII